MADSENIGNWKTAKLYEPWPPQWLEDFKQKVDTVAQFLIASLELANVMLDVIKAFLIGISDPITALIKALIKEIKKILEDLRQLGLYFTSDRKLMNYPFKDILGGFQGAEKRMIGRLNNRTDLGRPNVSTNSTVIGFMFYVSADSNAIYNLLNAINKILALFSFEVSGGGFSTVQNLSASYLSSDPEYTPTFGKDVFSSPAEVVVSWQQVKNANIMGINIPLAGPTNFIIEVSTEPYGLPLFITKQDNNKASPGGAKTSGTSGGGKQQVKTYPLTEKRFGIDQQVYLFGGADRLTYPSNYNYESMTDEGGKLKSGGAYVHTFLADNPTQPIPIHLLQDRSGSEPVYFLQRTFVEGSDADGGIFTNFGTNATFKIKPDQLPRAIKVSGTGKNLKITENTDEVVSTYYFRVTPTGPFEDRPFARYSVDERTINSEKNRVSNPVDMGSPSKSCSLRVARSTTVLYQQSVECALIVLLLSRADLDTVDRSTPFLQEDKEKLLGLFGISAEKFYSSDIKIIPFRKKIRGIVKRLTTQIVDRSGVLPQRVEEFLVESSKELREFTWDMYDAKLPKITLRESIGLVGDFEEERGLAPNIKSIPFTDLKRYERMFKRLITFVEPADSNMPPPPDTPPLEVKKSVRDRVLTSPSGDPSGNYFQRRKAENYDYFQNGVLKVNGKVLEVDKDGETYVLMKPKAEYFAVKEVKESGGINGNSPLIYTSRTAMNAGYRGFLADVTAQYQPTYFTRTVLINYNNRQLLEQSAIVLNVATSTDDQKAESEWDLVRVGDNGLLNFIEQFLNTILNTVQAILDALQGIIDAILKFIDFIQQRINEVQNLIRKINAIIQSIGLFEIPSASMVFFASKGTDGITRDLVSSQNKPQDPTSAYGFGAMGLMPIPLANVILDLFFPDTDIEGLVDDIVDGVVEGE